MTTRTTKQKTDSTSEAPVGVVDTEAIFKKAVESALHTLRTEFDQIFNAINSRLDSIEQKLKEQDETARDSNEIENIMESVEEIRQQSIDARRAANYAEQYGRRQNLRIQGLKVDPGTNCKVAALNLFRRNLNLDVNESDIAMAHIILRQTQTPTRQQQEPTVIVRFRDRNVRNCVIQNRRKLKGTSRSIVEDLTALNVKCLNRVKNNAVVQKTWTWNGIIHAETTSGLHIRVKPYLTVDEAITIATRSSN